MKESRVFQEVQEEERRAAILDALEVRFGNKAAVGLRDVLLSVTGSANVRELFRLAIQCRQIADFRRALESAAAVR